MKDGLELVFPEYYGDFGGIFVPDSFTPDLDALAKTAQEIVTSSSFDSNLKQAINVLDLSDIGTNIRYIDLKDGSQVIHAHSQAKYYNIAGQVALGSELKAKLLICGAEFPGSAIAFAKASQTLNLNSLVILNKEMSTNEELIGQLKKLSCEVDASTCSELFDMPQMYAFQKYMENRQEHYFVPLEANIGPYPFPALTGYFSNLYGKKLISSLPHIPECCAIPITTGTNAIGVFNAIESDKCKLVTVEEPICQEYHGVFCGCFTVITRMISGNDGRVVMCPELVNLWRKGKVIRLGCDHYAEVATNIVEGLSFSPEVSRVIALVIKEVGCREMLVVEADK